MDWQCLARLESIKSFNKKWVYWGLTASSDRRGAINCSSGTLYCAIGFDLNQFPTNFYLPRVMIEGKIALVIIPFIINTTTNIVVLMCLLVCVQHYLTIVNDIDGPLVKMAWNTHFLTNFHFSLLIYHFLFYYQIRGWSEVGQESQTD